MYNLIIKVCLQVNQALVQQTQAKYTNSPPPGGGGGIVWYRADRKHATKTDTYYRYFFKYVILVGRQPSSAGFTKRLLAGIRRSKDSDLANYTMYA